MADVDELEEVLRARERAKSRQRRSAFGSKFRQKVPASAPAALAHVKVRAIQAQDPSSESEGISGSDGSDLEGELRRIFLAVAEEKAQIQHDTESKRLREAESPIVATRETEITKIETAVPIVGPGNTRIWTVGHVKSVGREVSQRIAVCMRVVDAMTSMRQENAPWKNSTTRYANGMIRLDKPACSPNKYCIYAYVNKATTDRGRKESDLRGNTCNFHSYTAKIASLPQTSEFSRSNAEVALNLKRGESRGYWKPKISGRINQEKAILLLDTGAEVSILDTTFARKVGCNFDTSQRQQCVGIGDNVYFFDIWIGDLSGHNAILGMDFMVPAGVRMDLVDGSMRLPDEVGIPLNDRNRLYGEKVRSVILERNLGIPAPVASLVISNIGDEILRLDHRLDVGMILDQDKVPRSPGFESVGSRRYREWQNLALESTMDT
ncbi:hypothetical protein PHMEG_0005683 [Phytophthora megakarya]|uniref:Eukaryotic/viral aspartic protease n=1 Tax=Phytophthora megakarya TaxID=4795 RepID=A0A225WSB1_9STRA|nr:hypothetical protein PHMEG_0005683 [Phytophthora megakarya]